MKKAFLILSVLALILLPAAVFAATAEQIQQNKAYPLRHCAEGVIYAAYRGKSTTVGSLYAREPRAHKFMHRC